jgi:Na+/glutamate symporter
VSAIIGEVREKKKRKKEKRKKEKRKGCVRKVREKKKKKKEKKTRGMRGCFVLILVCVFFLEMLKYQLVSGGQKIPPFCTDRIAVALFNMIAI